MAQDHEIKLPQDTLARGLTPEEIEQVTGGTFEGQDAVKPDTSSLTTGCNPPKADADWD
ncbi:MAG TPA: hypothetical protein VFQ67_00595 [Allosphingosinicella sp.]|jgi:hypothetical protein|nr:hypothetical protein [Allosphingosinicella sp.]